MGHRPRYCQRTASTCEKVHVMSDATRARGDKRWELTGRSCSRGEAVAVSLIGL
jgi:hypothetical protein